MNTLVRSVVYFVLQMDSQSGETVEQTKETIKNGKKKWVDDKVQDLMELLEEKPCLWDFFFERVHKKVGERKSLCRIGETF